MSTYYVSSTGDDSNNGSSTSPYRTISKAISVATNGDIINVKEGTYNGNFDVSKLVTIVGPNVGISGNSSQRVNEAVLLNTKTNITTNATFDGFKFSHTADITDALIVQSGATIQNCVFERVSTTPGYTARAISTSANAANYNIKNNLFTGSTDGGLFSNHKTWNSGLFLTNGGYAGNIEGNTFVNCRTSINADNNNSFVALKNNEFSNCGTYVAFGGTTPPTMGMNMQDNTFNISTLASALINNSNVATSFNLNISNNKFKFENNILTSGELTLPQKFKIEEKMYHKGRSSRKGIVYFSNNEQFVISEISTITNALLFAPSSGDTIYVKEGTYNENLTINKSITLLGVNKDKTSTEVRNQTIQTKIVGGFTMSTSGITINGFEIVSDSTDSYPIIGNTSANNNNNITIKSNYIHDIKSQQGIYRAVTTNFVNNWLIDNNWVSDFVSGTSNTTAMYPNSIDGLTITNNTIKHYTNGANRRGLNIDSCSSITITNNTIDMNRDAYDDIYTIQLYWTYQKNGNIGPISITNNNLIGAYYGIEIVSKHDVNIKNTIDGVTISNNTFDTIDWMGLNIGNFWSYNFQFIMKNVNINNNIFKNMAFLTMTIGPEYDTNFAEFGTFDSNNRPIQNCRIYDNLCVDINDQPSPFLINLYSSPLQTRNPTIIYSDNPATGINSNGIILSKDLKYLHRANINGSSGYYGPIPNPVRIVSDSNADYLFNSYSDYFTFVNNFTGISDKHITNMLINETRISSDSDLQKILNYIVTDNPSNITLQLDSGTYGSTSVTTLSLNNSVTINGANINVSYKSTRNNESILLNHKFDVLTNNITINGIKVTGPQLAGGTIFGGDYKQFNNLIVKNSIIEDVNGMCLYYQGSGVRDGITFDNCKVSGIGNGTNGTGTSSAFNPWLCKNVTITNCLIENVDFNGINLETVENAIVTNNIIRNIGKSGIQLANSCKGTFNIKNNEFTQINCRYYGWGKVNARNNILNPYAPRTNSGTSEPDWQFYYAGIKWFSTANPLVHVGTYTIEENKFANCWCGYQFARELPATGGPIISFKNNIFQNNTHGDVMIYRNNTTNASYNLKDNGLKDASIKSFDYTLDGNGIGTLEQWTSLLDGTSEITIVVNTTSPALIDLDAEQSIVVQGMQVQNIIDVLDNNKNSILLGQGNYQETFLQNRNTQNYIRLFTREFVVITR